MNRQSFLQRVFADFESFKNKMGEGEFEYSKSIVSSIIYHTREYPTISRKVYKYIANHGKQKFSSYCDYRSFIHSVRKMTKYWFENEKLRVQTKNNCSEFPSSMNPICFLFIVRVCCVLHLLL